jgi:hypothetical protein
MMNKANQCKIACFLALQSFLFTFSTAQNPQESAVTKKELPSSWLDHQIQQDSNGILEVVLETDMKQLMKGKMSEQYQHAVFSYTDKDGTAKRYEVEIKARGKTRKQMCQHPPIKVKFKKSVLEAEGFGPYNDMKVVWECSESTNAEQYIYREYMTYQLYAMLTSASFRTKLVRISIADPKNPDRKIDKIGFMVEDEDQVADRNGGEMQEEPPKDMKLLLRQPNLIFGVFQYMIGNTDWSAGNSHNMRFIKLPGAVSRLIPVPYDFDYSGLVNTHYAAPDPNLGIPTVRDRMYRGSPGNETEFTLVRQKFIEVKPKMLAYAEAFPNLDKSSRMEFIKYLNEFFAILEDPKQFYRAINP